VDLLALDLGPGISDLAASMRDGHSTAGTSGNGLGAIKRLSQDFEAVSWPGRGTIVMARLTVNGTVPSRALSAMVLAKQGESVSGDAWSVHEGVHGQTLLVLLDVHLPDMNGLDVCKTIKKRWGHVMVLQTSATFITAADRSRGLEGGADSYLIEPIDPTELVATVGALLRTSCGRK
jgi:CheY-like chemotaxis protein